MQILAFLLETISGINNDVVPDESITIESPTKFRIYRSRLERRETLETPYLRLGIGNTPRFLNQRQGSIQPFIVFHVTYEATTEAILF